MAYRYDADLEFLGELDDKQLSVLVETLTRDKDGSSRWTEELTISDEYKKYGNKYSKYWQKIAEEIQTFGGNSFVNFFRGGGILYREILEDVCSKIDVETKENIPTEEIESILLMYLMEKSIEQMTEEERKELVNELDLKTTDFTKQAVVAAIQFAIRQSGFLAYQLAVTIANIIAKALLGHGLSFATNAAITRTIGIFAGPIGWAITGAWTAVDLAGPAYRVTIPVCIHIACLRQIHKYSKENNQAE